MEDAGIAIKKKPGAKDSAKRKKLISIGVLVVGLITLVVGAVFLVLNLTKGEVVADGDYLVSAGEWVLGGETNCPQNEENNCSPDVVWKFTEIGKGVLTTDGHQHDYDFIWAIEDGKLLIETAWLYDLENAYEYELDKDSGKLKLADENGEYEFVALSDL